MINTVFEQGQVRIFRIKVFEGDPAKEEAYNNRQVFGCPVMDDTIKVSTKIETGEANDVKYYETDSGKTAIGLIAGEPNILPPYTKNLNIDFEDFYRRAGANASFNLTPVVTGVKK